MLFNSFSFATFLIIVFVLYWFTTNNNYKKQNILLLLASYFFYSCWDWRFLFLLVFSTCLDFIIGIKLADSKNKEGKKKWLWLSVSLNLGFLCVFKYYNFFIESLTDLISHWGGHINPWSLNVIIPVGISFYTFHGLSYIFDIYN